MIALFIKRYFKLSRKKLKKERDSNDINNYKIHAPAKTNRIIIEIHISMSKF